MPAKRKVNPESLKNLRPGESPGRTPIHDARKNRHGVSLTDEGWQGVEKTAKGLGYSISELLEQIGRGKLAVLGVDALEAIQDALDLAEAQAAIAEAQEQGTKTLEQVLAEIGLG
jgi:hypothetical protein